jgi:hypothetical protein
MDKANDKPYNLQEINQKKKSIETLPTVIE